MGACRTLPEARISYYRSTSIFLKERAMPYFIAWLLGVPVFLLVLIYLLF
jgi:hypothetical protein